MRVPRTRESVPIASRRLRSHAGPPPPQAAYGRLEDAYPAGRIDAAIAISSARGIELVSVLETQ
jgi:hypothetical protein